MKLLLCLIVGHKPFLWGNNTDLMVAQADTGRVVFKVNPCSRCGLLFTEFK